MKRVERILQSKRSAEYVKNLATATPMKQTYLYQRYIEESQARQSPQKRSVSPSKLGEEK